MNRPLSLRHSNPYFNVVPKQLQNFHSLSKQASRRTAISRASLDSIPTAFAFVSVGTSNDPLPNKLKAISQAGFRAIELGFLDLVSFASTYHKKGIKEDDYDSLCSAGVEVSKLCTACNLGIIMLQPFSNFEGWSYNSKERKEAFDRAKGWIKVMQVMGTNTLQVRPFSNMRNYHGLRHY